MFDEVLTQDIVLLCVRAMIVGMSIAAFWYKAKDIRGYARAENTSTSIALLLATAEIVGAVSIMSGIHIRYGALLLILRTIAIILRHVLIWKSPYSARHDGWEYDVLFLLQCMTILAFGGGTFILTL